MKIDKKDIRAFICILVVVALQSLSYYIGKLFVVNPVLVTTSFDNNTPYIPYFVWFYVIWYLYVPIVPFILYKKDKDVFYKYLISLVIGVIFTFITFVIFPTTINRMTSLGNTISDQLVKLLYMLDEPSCCLPSLHCLLCFYISYATLSSKKLSLWFKVGVNLLSLLIILSTLFIKQHGIIDVIGSFVISITAFLIINKKDVKWIKNIIKV